VGAKRVRAVVLGLRLFRLLETTGVMAVQICRKSRAEVKDLSGINPGYLAYFGRYEIDPEKQVVRHIIKGRLFPGDHPGFSKGSTGSMAISCR
jgi:hypothetical protein